jgi:hypothetical protein
MSTPAHIRRHIDQFAGDKPFSIRDCLVYGSRNVVDQAFHRMIKHGSITRVARGVYIKSTAPPPSIIEIVQVKAAAFGRTVAPYASQNESELAVPPLSDEKLVFASDGPTSSFRIGDQCVHLRRVSYRKMKKSDAEETFQARELCEIGSKQ